MSSYTFDDVISLLKDKIPITFVVRNQSQWPWQIFGVSAFSPSFIDPYRGFTIRLYRIIES